MKLDIVSDTVCPWCYVGKRRLDKALDKVGRDTFDIMWRPFQLDPFIPAEGVDRKSYLRAKFGSDAMLKASASPIRSAGADENIPFDFEAIKTSPNTLDSHRLIRWAHSAGCQDRVVELLFKAYFEDGKNIGDRNVLVGVAEEAGMDGGLVADLLSKDADIDLVRREDGLAREMEIHGVPTFIIDNRFAISGAQDPEVLIHFIERAQKKAGTAEPGRLQF